MVTTDHCCLCYTWCGNLVRGETSMSDAAKGLAGVIAADTTLSRVDGEKGELIYRGYDIMDLGEKACFEEVVYLLWNGDLPNRAQ
jgi:citrate synthase